MRVLSYTFNFSGFASYTDGSSESFGTFYDSKVVGSNSDSGAFEELLGSDFGNVSGFFASLSPVIVNVIRRPSSSRVVSGWSIHFFGCVALEDNSSVYFDVERGVDGSFVDHLGSASSVGLEAIFASTVFNSADFSSSDDAIRDSLVGVTDNTVVPGVINRVFSPILAVAKSGDLIYAAGGFIDSCAVAPGLVVYDKNFNIIRTYDVVGIVTSIVVDGSGNVFVGGIITSVGGTNVLNLAKILPDGSVVNGNAAGVVRALLLYGDKLHVGGQFTTIGGTARNGYAILNVSDLSVTSVDPALAGSADVYVIAENAGIFYLGGIIDGTAGNRQNLCAFNAAGVLQAFTPGANAVVYNLVIYNDKVYVGGIFDGAGTIGALTSRYKFAVFNLSGALQSSPGDLNILVDGSSTNASVTGFCIYNDVIYMIGAFNSILGSTRFGSAAISLTGTLLDWTIDLDTISIVYGYAPQIAHSVVSHSGKIVARTNINGLSDALLVLDPVTAEIEHIVYGSFTSTIQKTLSYDTNLYVGGLSEIMCENGTRSNGVAVFDVDGVSQPFSASIGRIGNVYSYDMAINDDIVYVCGQFLEANEIGRTYVAAFDLAGGLEDFHPVPNGVVNSLTVLNDIVYVVGQFTSVNGTARNRAAAFNAAGTLQSWNPSVLGGLIVSTIRAYDGKLYICGSFIFAGGQLRSHFAVIDTDGAASAFAPTFDAQCSYLDIFGTTLYVCGTFTSVTLGGASSRVGIAAFNLSNGTLKSFAISSISYYFSAGGINYVYEKNGLVYITGNFYLINGVRRNGFAVFDTNGVLQNEYTNVSMMSDNIYEGGRIIDLGGGRLLLVGRGISAKIGDSTYYGMVVLDNGTAMPFNISG